MGSGVSEVLSSVVEDVGQAISRNINGAQVLHELLSAPWLRNLLKIYECLLQFQRLKPSPFLPYASGLLHEIMTVMQRAHCPSAEARELYSLLSSPHIQALLSSHDSVAQSDYGPVLPPLPDELPEDEEAMRIVCLVKNNQPLNGEDRRGNVEDGVQVIRSRWSSLRRLTLERLIPARRAWSREELRATESEARLLPLSRGGQSCPFLPRYESTGSCCWCPQTTELLKKEFNQSAPSVFSPTLCTGSFSEKPKHNGGEGNSIGGNSDDYAHPPPPIPAYSLSLSNSPVLYKKGAIGGHSRNIPTPGRASACPRMNPVRAHTAPSSPATQHSTRKQGVSTLPISGRQHGYQTGPHNRCQEESLNCPSMLHYSTAPHHNGCQNQPKQSKNKQQRQPKHHQHHQPPELTKQRSVEELRSTVQTLASSIEHGTHDVCHLGQKMVAATEMITDSVEENAQALNLLAEVVDKLQGLIVASKHPMPSPPCRPKQHSPPQAPPRVSSISPKGATIRRDEETGEIYIARVIHGGLADRSGLLHPGDLLVEVNGNPVVGLEPEQVIQILINSQGTILFKVIPNAAQTSSSQKPVYMRAMVDYCPLQDSSIPCPDAGMAFSRGDLLEVVDQSDGQWWQARKLYCPMSYAGLIPSASMLKSTSGLVIGAWSHNKTENSGQNRSPEQKDDLTQADDKLTIAAGFRRSFRLWRRTSYRRRRQSCTSCSPSSSALSTPYEEVALYQRPPQENHRLIILVGASGVGVNELRKRLIKLNPSTFQGPLPHTTRPIRAEEQTGREYHFVTKELFEYMVCNHRFVEYGEYKGHLYGTSTDAIDEVLKRGRMCIIDVEPHCIQPLRARKLKPYVIFIKAPSPDRLRQTRRDARIITNYTISRAFKEDDFVELEEASRLMEAKYKQFFDSVLVNDDLQDACMQLCSIMQQAQDEPQWIPTAIVHRNITMPTVKSKKKKPKKEVNDGEEQAEVGLEVEMEEMTNRSHSESRDPLTPEPQDPAPQKKKKKRKAPTIDQEAENADMPNGDMSEPMMDGEEMTVAVTRRTKRKRKAKATEHYSNDLGAEDDDIITDAQSPIPQHSLFSAPHGHSQPVGKVFVERNRRFQAERVEQLRHSELMDDYMDPRQIWTTRDIAMRVHSGFRVIGLFSHGFLAGYAVWNIIVVYVLAGEQMTTLPNLLQQYHPLAYPAQSLLYLLLAISTVSAFDRVNLAKASMALRGFLTLDPAALASFLYFIALILSLSQQMTSDRINLYPTANETLWPPGSEQQILRPWIVVNLVVALLVGLAWAVVSTRPDIDYTEEFLMTMEVEGYPRGDENLDIPA
eukprot:superscaffoldBa00000873_g7734